MTFVGKNTSPAMCHLCVHNVVGVDCYVVIGIVVVAAAPSIIAVVVVVVVVVAVWFDILYC